VSYLSLQNFNRFILLFPAFVATFCSAQIVSFDSTNNPLSFSIVAIPTTLLVTGFTGSYIKQIKNLNISIRDKVIAQNFKPTTIDDYLAPLPVVSVYGLNLLGNKGRHNFIERTEIIGTSYAIAVPLVLGLKEVTNISRPDNSNNRSLPSGHTAVAFAGAEFAWQEYKHKNIWIGVSAYGLACATAALRMRNNRHWLTDIAAGAGIGILSTKVAYKIHPWVNKTLNIKSNQTVNIGPYVNQKAYGLSFALQL